MYKCPPCHVNGIAATAVFSMGKRMLVRCQPCGASSYRTLPMAVELVRSLILTFLGGALILTKGEPMLSVVWLLGTLMVLVLANHLCRKMVPYKEPLP